jgi:hypothetical protein
MSIVSSRRGLAAVAGALALFAGLTAALMPGRAGGTIVPVQPPCKAGMLCVYADDDYAGQVVRITKRGISNAIFAEMAYSASSVKNRRGKIAYLYEFADGKGYRVCLEPHEQLPSLSPLGFNDAANSSKNVRRATRCPRDLNGTCNTREFCVYEHDNYEGRIIELSAPGFSDLLQRRMNDAASSVKNRRASVSRLYEAEKGEIGAVLCVEDHQFLPTLGKDFNDIASATRLSRNQTICPF